MKKFLLMAFALLVIALLAVIAVFCYLTMQLQSSQQSVPVDEVSGTTTATESTNGTAVVAEGIPLRDLSLSDPQRSVLSKVGVDIDTFVITPSMQACAAEKLGAERLAEVIGGAAPSVLETTKLLPCLGGT